MYNMYIPMSGARVKRNTFSFSSDFYSCAVFAAAGTHLNFFSLYRARYNINSPSRNVYSSAAQCVCVCVGVRIYLQIYIHIISMYIQVRTAFLHSIIIIIIISSVLDVFFFIFPLSSFTYIHVRDDFPSIQSMTQVLLLC